MLNAPSRRVRWCEPPRPTQAMCMLCGNEDGNVVVLEALHSNAALGYIDLARCGRCESAWFPDTCDMLTYPAPDEVLGDPGFWTLIHHYVEIGCGTIVDVLERTPFERYRSVLDVGCSVGVQLDYCRTMWGADVVGVEPSAYGAAGRQLLGLPILTEYMADASELQGRTFDLVYSSEVVEHVPDPAGFLAELRSFVAPGGVAVLTTPRAGAVSPDTPLGELYAALSTGGHYFLAAPAQLRSMLADAGFGWSYVEPWGVSQIAIAADEPIELGPGIDRRRRLRDYYAARVSRPSGDRRLHLGDLLNLYVANRSLDAGSGADLEPAIAEALAGQFDVHIDDLAATVDRLTATTSIHELGERMPFRLPAYLWWRGHRDDLGETERTEMWEAAGVLAAHGIRVEPVMMAMPYEPVLQQVTGGLGGRAPSTFGKRFRAALAATPEAGGLTVARPSAATTARSLAGHWARRLRLRRGA